MENNLSSELAQLKREVWALSKKIGSLSTTFDDTPTAGSNNPVKSSGIKSALDLKANSASLSTVATSGSYNDLSNKPIIDFSYSDGTLTITCQETSSEEE